MISTKPAEKRYNLTTKEMYLGIGLVDNNQNELNISDYPYLKFFLNLVILDENNNRSTTNIPLEKLHFSLFINQIDFENMNAKDINLTNSRMPYYCIVANSTFNFIPDTFDAGHIYLDFSLTDINNSYYFNASNNLNYKRPRLNLFTKE